LLNHVNAILEISCRWALAAMHKKTQSRGSAAHSNDRGSALRRRVRHSQLGGAAVKASEGEERAAEQRARALIVAQQLLAHAGLMKALGGGYREDRH
jgi:hypothetical protein